MGYLCLPTWEEVPAGWAAPHHCRAKAPWLPGPELAVEAAALLPARLAHHPGLPGARCPCMPSPHKQAAALTLSPWQHPQSCCFWRPCVLLFLDNNYYLIIPRSTVPGLFREGRVNCQLCVCQVPEPSLWGTAGQDNVC